ncbi:hypothetical protein [Kumtagia ephedrae]|uniref:Uncharacterized protein n=1 Tax=Kumtagia ephedrae TaxID=2116701 RepID=A0A2P7RVJ3_9HYPH|nr:hypothetical protein [Mesorhizobium ephedrae]PSJ54223.1 hypothetical protein C7I84_24860 [Mesorhizobium ephedrae]
MISYVKRTDMHSVTKDAEDNRFEQIHKAAVEKRRKGHRPHETPRPPDDCKQSAAVMLNALPQH